MKAAAILKAREERGLEIVKLEKAYSMTVISVTVNIPGGNKAHEDYSWIGVLAFNEIRKRLAQNSIIHESFRYSADGPEGFIVSEGKPEELKKIAVNIEESHPLGRLFDIDISGHSRMNNGEKRACFLCGGDANRCRRIKNHSISDLMSEIDSLIEDWDETIIENAVQSVVVAMRKEVDATPKPGLVDQMNNGSHSDMEYVTFIKSIQALKPYFKEMAVSATCWNKSAETLFSALRPIGKKAEEAMLKATGGVNTHRGQIFSLGLAVGAGCYLKRRGEATTDAISAFISEMVRGISYAELKIKTEPSTHGEKMYDAYGVTGIRGEAEKGFKAAFNVGLPAYEEALSSGLDENSAAVKSLVFIMAVLEDSNVYRRGGPNSAAWVKKTASCLMENGMSFKEFPLSQIREFDAEMIRRNISPGGAADMLALAIFVNKFMAS